MSQIERGRSVGLIDAQFKIKITHALRCGDILQWDRASGFLRYVYNIEEVQNHD